MSNEAYLEESASLRAHMLALHAFSTLTALATANAVELAGAALTDVKCTTLRWSAEMEDAVREFADRDRLRETEASLTAARRSQQLVRREALVLEDQVSVFRSWMEEKFQDAFQAILQGLGVFARANAGGDDREGTDEEIAVSKYVTISLPRPGEIPACHSIYDAAHRIYYEVCPALGEAREQFERSWQAARVDWPEEMVDSYGSNHYAEIDRAVHGFELVLEHLTRELDAAIEGLPARRQGGELPPDLDSDGSSSE